MRHKVQLIPVPYYPPKLLAGMFMWKPHKDTIHQLDEESIEWIMGAINEDHQVLATTPVQFYLTSDEEVLVDDLGIQNYRKLVKGSEVEENRKSHQEIVELLGAQPYWVKKVVVTPEQIGYFYSPISSSATEAGVGTNLINVDQLQKILHNDGICYIDYQITSYASDDDPNSKWEWEPKLINNKVIISENEKDFEIEY